MQKVKVQDAVGKILCHDITEIIPGEFKGAAFKKGHVIEEKDIAHLLKLGKEHIFVWEQKKGFIHENEGAVRLARCSAGKGVAFSEPSEGRVNLLAAHDGILKIKKDLLLKINSIGDLVIATLHNNRVVKKDTTVAGAKIIPLVIEENKIIDVENIYKQGGAVIEILPFKNLQVGVIITGSEVYKGRIKDGFTEVVKGKIESLGGVVSDVCFAPDNEEIIKDQITSMVGKDMELIIVTGGMSVDPDDVTPTAIRMSGAAQVAYGVPVLPGAMFMLAYLNAIPIVGLPGCAMYSKTTVFDLVLPRIFAGEKINHRDLLEMAHGGLCLSCEKCYYPQCPFGKV